jgi:RHS repeat-associated protein
MRPPGQYKDEETNLNYNYIRDYNPILGRYVESDPMGLTAGINTYGYVGGNPLSRIDRNGTNWIIFGVTAIGGLAGAYEQGETAYYKCGLRGEALFTSSRTFGPKAIQLYTGEVAGDGPFSPVPSDGDNCGCPTGQ